MTENELPRLRPKHKSFADEWIICKNGQKAAVEAGYSEKHARITAYKILQRPEVKAYIKQELDKHIMDEIEAKRLIGKTAREAKSETVRLRALEKIIDMHGLTNKPLDGELVLRVVRENVGSKDFSQDTNTETADNSIEPV